jgi:hypothetical protein
MKSRNDVGIEKHLSVTETELETGISKWTWRRMAYRGDVASVKVGTRLLIPLSEINRVLQEGTRPRLQGVR